MAMPYFDGVCSEIIEWAYAIKESLALSIATFIISERAIFYKDTESNGFIKILSLDNQIIQSECEINLQPRDLMLLLYDIEKSFDVRIDDNLIVAGKFNTFSNIYYLLYSKLEETYLEI